MPLLIVPVVLLLALICWQDVRYRAVYWFLFPAVLLLMVANGLAAGTMSPGGLVANLLLSGVLLSGLQLYVSCRGGGWLMAGERYLGWGDVLFFVVAATAFSPLHFLAFQAASCLLILLAVLLLRAIGLPVETVPLAGGQAFLLALLLVADGAAAGRTLYTEDIMTNILLYGTF